jgi:hypothetical protein
MFGVVIDEMVYGLAEIYGLLEHEVFRTLSQGAIQRDGHRGQIVVTATLAKRFPKRYAFSDSLRNGTEFDESRERGHAVLVYEVLEKMVDKNVDDVGDATNVVFFVIPIDTMSIRQ